MEIESYIVNAILQGNIPDIWKIDDSIDKGVWIGITEDKDNNPTVKLTYSNYGPGQPDQEKETCVALDVSQLSWKDRDCTTMYPFACEYLGKCQFKNLPKF